MSGRTIAILGAALVAAGLLSGCAPYEVSPSYAYVPCAPPSPSAVQCAVPVPVYPYPAPYGYPYD